MESLCLICRKPNRHWIEFLTKFTHYTIYIVIDDNDVNYQSKYPNSKINFIQIPNSKCEITGFTNMNFISKKLITGWEKAVYFFANLETNYTNVWFIEDDVFFYDESTLLEIDKIYPNSDLLTNSVAEYKEGTWNWSHIKINFPPPWYSAMVCATRVSKPLINLIKTYADEHKALFFLEALFPTICKRANLVYDFPEELKTALYNNPIQESDLDKRHIFHPVKKLRQQAEFRILLNTKDSKIQV